MVHISKDERKTLTMAMAIDYVTSLNSIRTLAAKYGVPKTTVHIWITECLPAIDTKLSEIVQRKIYCFKKQKWYDFKLTAKDNEVLKARKRFKYSRIVDAYSKDFKDPIKR